MINSEREMLYFPGEIEQVQSPRLAKALIPLVPVALSSVACSLEGEMGNRLGGALSGALGGLVILLAWRSFFGGQIEKAGGRNYADEEEARKGCLELIVGFSPVILGFLVGGVIPELGYVCGPGTIIASLSALMAEIRKRKER